LLWPFHAAHHSSVEVDWWSNERVHPVESVINATLQAVTLVMFGFAPAAIGLAVAIRQTYSAFTHANVRLSFGPLGWLFVSPHSHSAQPAARTSAVAPLATKSDGACTATARCDWPASTATSTANVLLTECTAIVVRQLLARLLIQPR